MTTDQHPPTDDPDDGAGQARTPSTGSNGTREAADDSRDGSFADPALLEEDDAYVMGLGYDEDMQGPRGQEDEGTLVDDEDEDGAVICESDEWLPDSPAGSKSAPEADAQDDDEADWPSAR
jgi:hypothetical protein